MILSQLTAVVTGGNSGIGQGIVQILLESGAKVISADLAFTEDDYKVIDGQLSESRLDLSRSEDIYRWSDIVLEQSGVPDIVVNCAGISTMDYIIDSKLEDWEKVFSINSTGLYLVSKIFAKKMVEAGKPGRIIQMASQAGKNGYRAMGGYCTSKHAVLG